MSWLPFDPECRADVSSPILDCGEARSLFREAFFFKERLMLPIRTILHPTDFSEGSENAFRLACSLTRDYRARLIVLHVLERPAVAYSGVMMAPPSPGPSAEERHELRERLRQIQPLDPAVHVEHILEEGDPATAISQVVQERDCNLIVMGTHGRTGFSRMLMGSVAEQVVRQSPRPVVTVKTPFPETTLVECRVTKVEKV
jgi:nucleotide-binding universal stress UspA family protein